MKGQLSLEYLVLTVVTLAVISIAIVTLAKVKNDSDTALLLLKLKGDANAVFNSVQDVCALGDGNAREISLAGTVYGKSSGEALELSNPIANASLIFKTRCETNVDGKLKDKAIIENQDGVVQIKNA